jgi:hypothetical protein
MTRFAKVPPTVWHLRGNLAKLPSPRYETILHRIAKEATVVSFRRQRAKSRGGFFRARITLSCSASVISLFHSARTGYRAQYYVSTACGDRANAFALKLLVPRIRKLLTGFEKRTCALWWIERSLLDPAAKVWIYQGDWLRLNRRTERNLYVRRWTRAQSNKNRKRSKKARWSILTPRHEDRLELKGGFISAAGEPLGSLKRDRSKELHELGFT